MGRARLAQQLAAWGALIALGACSADQKSASTTSAGGSNPSSSTGEGGGTDAPTDSTPGLDEYCDEEGLDHDHGSTHSHGSSKFEEHEAAMHLLEDEAASAVRYDLESDDALHCLKVAGYLEFSRDQSTKMRVDTIIGTPHSYFIAGTEEAPIDADVTTNIEIVDGPPIDTKEYGFYISRGVVLHGVVRFHGARVTPFVPVADSPLAGGATVAVDSAPSGWKAGDEVLIVGTHRGNGLTRMGTATKHPGRGPHAHSNESRGAVLRRAPHVRPRRPRRTRASHLRREPDAQRACLDREPRRRARPLHDHALR